MASPRAPSPLLLWPSLEPPALGRLVPRAALGRRWSQLCGVGPRREEQCCTVPGRHTRELEWPGAGQESGQELGAGQELGQGAEAEGGDQ